MKLRSVAPLLALSIASLPGCGGGGGGTPSTPSTPTPPPRVRTVVSEGATTDMPVNALLYVSFSNPSRGDLDVTVDWTFPSDRIHVYVSPNECSIDSINNDQCPFIIDSPPSSVKPRRLTVTAVAAGPHTLYIGNRGPEVEAVSWQVGLTTGGAASAAVRAHGVRSGPDLDWSALVRR